MLGSALAQFDNLVVLVYGDDGQTVQNSIGVYDLKKETVEVITSYFLGGNWPSPRTYSAMACQQTQNSRCILFGGLDKSGTLLNDIHILTEDHIYIDPEYGHDLTCLYGIGFCSSLTSVLGYYSTNYNNLNFGLVDYIVTLSNNSNATTPRMAATGLSSISLSTSLSIKGNPSFILDCEHNPCFVVSAPNNATTVTLDSFIIMNGHIQGLEGGGVGRGGALNIFNATVRLNNMQFVNNSAILGGAIYAEQASLFITQSIFTENTALVAGGSAYFYGCYQIEYNNCQIIQNTAQEYAGAIFSALSTVNFDNSNFSSIIECCPQIRSQRILELEAQLRLLLLS